VKKINTGKALSGTMNPRELRRFFWKILFNYGWVQREQKRTRGTRCWFWGSHKDEKGYGQFWWKGRAQWVHRVSYCHFIKDIPEGVEIDHICKIPCCVNPEHLRIRTVQENRSTR